MMYHIWNQSVDFVHYSTFSVKIKTWCFRDWIGPCPKAKEQEEFLTHLGPIVKVRPRCLEWVFILGPSE